MPSLVGRWRLVGGLSFALLLVALVPLLRADAAARQQAWVDACARRGALVETLPAEPHNPLVVQTGHLRQQCRAPDGRILSERD